MFGPRSRSPLLGKALRASFVLPVLIGMVACGGGSSGSPTPSHAPSSKPTVSASPVAMKYCLDKDTPLAQVTDVHLKQVWTNLRATMVPSCSVLNNLGPPPVVKNVSPDKIPQTQVDQMVQAFRLTQSIQDWAEATAQPQLLLRFVGQDYYGPDFAKFAAGTKLKTTDCLFATKINVVELSVDDANAMAGTPAFTAPTPAMAFGYTGPCSNIYVDVNGKASPPQAAQGSGFTPYLIIAGDLQHLGDLTPPGGPSAPGENDVPSYLKITAGAPNDKPVGARLIGAVAMLS